MPTQLGCRAQRLIRSGSLSLPQSRIGARVPLPISEQPFSYLAALDALRLEFPNREGPVGSVQYAPWSRGGATTPTGLTGRGSYGKNASRTSGPSDAASSPSSRKFKKERLGTSTKDPRWKRSSARLPSSDRSEGNRGGGAHAHVTCGTPSCGSASTHPVLAPLGTKHLRSDWPPFGGPAPKALAMPHNES